MPDRPPRRARFSERNLLAVLVLIFVARPLAAADAPPLPDTAPLTTEGDLASQMVDGIDRFLTAQTLKAIDRRREIPSVRTDLSSREALLNSTRPLRERLATILGVRDPRAPRVEMQLLATTDRPALVGKSDAFEAYAVRWPAFGDVHGEGLLLKPIGREPVADVIAIPDADQTPETIAGLREGVPAPSQFARRLAESGCRVIVPVLLDRRPRQRLAPGRKTGPELSNREFVYRSAFELGRHVIGYEIQKVLAAVDWSARENPERPVGLVGYGEGGMIALYAAALDPRVRGLAVTGYVRRGDQIWKEPIERNLFGILDRFPDQELIKVLAGRGIVTESSTGPRVKVAGKGAAPGELADPADLSGRLTPPATDETLRTFLGHLLKDKPAVAPPGNPPQPTEAAVDPDARQARQLHELDRHTQELLARSAEVRREFMKKLDTSSPEKFQQSAKPYREHLYRDVLGRFDDPLLPPNARTRKVYDTDKYTGYDVVLDVFPDVFAYGVLLLPKDLKDGERRPVVVCQHGLEGRPKDTVEGNNQYYHAFAARLCERGFITFAPQNLYIFGDRFRTLGRKANPLGKTIWSIIIPQHQQILNFLKGLPSVDPKHIAFYGLSYGGKTAMRVPAVLEDYCLSICSGDFNEWVYKNSSTTWPLSYVFTNEYEIFEFDLGSTFNYAEMAALIAPRPFMVERGHFDTVSTDEWVAFEFAKVRRLYHGQLKLPPDRCQIEFFDGPHTIHGVGTFDFLHEHLNWEKPR